MTSFLIFVGLLGVGLWTVKVLFGKKPDSMKAANVAVPTVTRNTPETERSTQTIAVTSSSVSDGTASDMFCTPKQAHGEMSLSNAYWQVMSEITGDGLTSEMLTAIKPAFIDALGDPKRAGRLLADSLCDITWDWPRWHAFAKRRGYQTVMEVPQMTGKPDLYALLYGTLKADLVRLGESLDVTLPKSLSKTEMLKRLMVLPASKFEIWVDATKDQRPVTEVQKVRREMGRFIASRVMTLALRSEQLQQRLEPGFVALQPFWKFECQDDPDNHPPKKCRDMNGKVLPMDQARKHFPSLPCDRLDCYCEIYTRHKLESI